MGSPPSCAYVRRKRAKRRFISLRTLSLAIHSLMGPRVSSRLISYSPLSRLSWGGGGGGFSGPICRPEGPGRGTSPREVVMWARLSLEF